MSLLILDDDKPFLQRLARAMEARGYEVDTADTVAEGLEEGRGRRRRPSPSSTFGSRTATVSTSSN